MLIKWLIFLHVLGAVTFFLSHGAAAALTIRIHKESELERMRAMLDLSPTLLGAFFGSFLLMGLTGLIMPFVMDLWGEIWIWLSIVLMLFVTFWMGWMNERGFKPLRRLVGQPYMKGNKQFPAEPPADMETIRKHIAGINVRATVIVGYAIPMVVLWLMVFKPF